MGDHQGEASRPRGVDVPFEETADATLNRTALQMLGDQTLAVKGYLTDGIASAHVWGACPRCTHRIDIRRTLSAPLGLTRGGPDHAVVPSDTAGSTVTSRRLAVDALCNCPCKHDGAPQGRTGCGASFRVITTVP
jgi:hypothetical protein